MVSLQLAHKLLADTQTDDDRQRNEDGQGTVGLDRGNELEATRDKVEDIDHLHELEPDGPR